LLIRSLWAARDDQIAITQFYLETYINLNNTRIANIGVIGDRLLGLTAKREVVIGKKCPRRRCHALKRTIRAQTRCNRAPPDNFNTSRRC
jgi:hypothetical protein